MRVILNPLMPNKDGYLTPVKPSQVYHADVKTLVEILKDLFFEKHLALTVDFDE